MPTGPDQTAPVRRRKGWWIKHAGRWYGPYATRAEAESDRRGLARFAKHKDRPGFITTEKTP